MWAWRPISVLIMMEREVEAEEKGRNSHHPFSSTSTSVAPERQAKSSA